VRQTKRTAVVAKKVRKQPPVAKKKAATPKKAVEALQDELASLLGRGHSVEEVRQVLRGAGMEISTVTLQGYARSLGVTTKHGASAPPTNAAPAKKKAVAAKSATRGASASSSASSAAPARKISSPPPASAKTRATAAKSQAASKGKFHDFQLAKATFIVRPDTPDSDL
jgi:hypothetical protein